MPFEVEFPNNFIVERATRNDFLDVVTLPAPNPESRAYEDAYVPVSGSSVLFYRLKLHTTFGHTWGYPVPHMMLSPAQHQTAQPTASFGDLPITFRFFLPTSTEILQKVSSSTAKNIIGQTIIVDVNQPIIPSPDSPGRYSHFSISNNFPQALPAPYPPVNYNFTINPGQPRLSWSIPDLLIFLELSKVGDSQIDAVATNYATTPQDTTFWLYGANLLAHERVPVPYANSVSGDLGSGGLICSFEDNPPRFHCVANVQGSDVPYRYQFIMQATANDLGIFSFPWQISGTFTQV